MNSIRKPYGHFGPLLGLCCFSKSESTSKNYTTNVTQDKRVTSDSGDILSVEDTGINVGGNFTIESSGVAKAAISAVENVAQSNNATVQALAAGSNDISSQVAQSQQKISEIVSGQKTAIWISGLGVLAAVAFALAGRKKAA